MQVEIWGPPNVSIVCIREKVDEWCLKHPNMPPYERFLQDYVSSQWPLLWHMKRKFVLDLSVPVESILEPASETCSICQNSLDYGSETFACGHIFHTMCIHRWLQRSTTCPLCRCQLT